MAEKAYHYVYKTTCASTKEFYIGVHSSNSEFDPYLGSGKLFLRKLKEYGQAAFSKEVIHRCRSRKEALQLERTIVTKDLLANPLCLNVFRGGGNSAEYCGHTEDVKSQLSEVVKARWADPEYGDQLRAKFASPETRKKISDGHKRYWTDEQSERRSEQTKAAWRSGKVLGKTKQTVIPDGCDVLTYDGVRHLAKLWNIAPCSVRQRLRNHGLVPVGFVWSKHPLVDSIYVESCKKDSKLL